MSRLDEEPEPLTETIGVPPPLPHEARLPGRSRSASELSGVPGWSGFARRHVAWHYRLAALLFALALLLHAGGSLGAAWRLKLSTLAVLALTAAFWRLVGAPVTAARFERQRERARQRILRRRAAHVPPTALSRLGPARGGEADRGLSRPPEEGPAA